MQEIGNGIGCFSACNCFDTPTTNSQDVHKINKCVCEIYETIRNRSESVNRP
jgi:hypothetical protein